MRYLLRISFLIIIMTLTTATASADKYSRAWKKVENYIKLDLPESAAKEINHIWDMATKDGDGRQMLKSAVYLTQVQQTYGENSIIEGIELFRTLLPTLKVQEHKALCHAFIAKGYLKYWELNKYNGSRRIQTDEENPPLDHWTPRMICDTICYHLDQSINLAANVSYRTARPDASIVFDASGMGYSDYATVKGVSSGYYEEFFPGGNKAGQKLRPQLVDMLLDNAVVLVTDYRLTLAKRKFFDDPRLYGTMQDFLNATRNVTPDDPDLWMFYVLHRLTRNNLNSKPNIRCTIDIRRMIILNEYLGNDGKWDSNDEEWLKGVVALAQSYTKKVKFSTMFYSMAARKIEDNISQIPVEKAANLQRQARDICIAAQKKWPKSEGALECLSIKDRIERKNVRIEINRDFLPGERNIAKLSYSNVNTVYFKVVETGGRITNAGDEISLLSALNQSNTVVEWSMRINDPGDYLEHAAIFGIAPVMQGSYYLLASTGPYFSSGDCISYQYIECNGIQFVKMAQNDGTLYGTAVNTRTGQPVPDCKYTLWRLNSDGDMSKLITSGITESDGVILIEGIARDRYKIELEANGSKGNATFNIPWRNTDMPGRQFVKVYTDRYTYLPGDSVQYSGVLYHKDGDNGHVLPGVKVMTAFEGNDDEERIDTLVTDSMGVFRGTFKIPENIMPGRYDIWVENPEDSEYDFDGYAMINVESFRQPKFQVSFKSCNDDVSFDAPVTITGKAMTYTGLPVDGASVTWFAGVSNYSCHRFCIPDERGDIRIGAGDIKTNSDGTFSFDVTVPSDIMIGDNAYVRVTAVVTDLNGETHEASTNFNAALKPSHSIIISSPGNVLDRNGQKTFYISAYGDNGNVSARINVKVSRLSWGQTPGLPLPFNPREGLYHDWEVNELAASADNQNMRDKFPLYDFDFKGDETLETTVFEGVVPFDVNDWETSELILDGLQSGTYRIEASAEGCKPQTSEFTLCREDDYTFVPQKPLLWGYQNNGRQIRVEAGDVAHVRLGSSRKGAVIHYIVENKYGKYDSGTLVSDGRQQTIDIPVTDELIGYFAVHCCVLYEGVSENISYTFEVPDRKHQLKMELVTFRGNLEPDMQEEWKIRVTDWQGNPVKAAVMLDMYDQALDLYGTNRIYFQPFSATYVGSRRLFENRNTYSSQYLPWVHTFGNAYEYKGKRAITGTLIDPFNYRTQLTASMLRSVKAYSKNSDLSRMTGYDNGEEETILAVDEALQGRVAGLDVVFSSGELGARSDVALAESPIQAVTVRVPSDGISIRTNLKPIGLFEYLVTDEDGMGTYRFSAPQLLTRWKIQGISFTDSLKSGRIDTTMVTRKLIMVEPSAPRFLRQGDRMEFTAKVSNVTDQDVKADVVLTLTDAVTGKALGIIEGANKKSISIPQGGSTATSFTIKVPAGLTAVTYRLTAQTKGHSDGMEETIPVLSNRTQVTQALSLFNNGNEKREFRFTDLEKPRSATMDDEQLTLEYSATPIWYAIQALPSMIRVDDPSNLRLFHSFMGASISESLSSRYPAIRRMLDEWAALPASEWQTQLERNQQLTATLLEETPWLRSSQSERDRLRSLAQNLGSEETAKAMRDALQKLQEAQAADGGWPWIEGLGSSLHITDEILQGLGLLIENGVIEVTPELKETIQRGLDYMDGYFYKLYNVDHKPESLGYSELSYLLTRSYFTSYPFSATTRASHTYFTRLASMKETHELDLWFRAQLALLMARNGEKEQAEHVAATLLERSQYSDEMGRYWRDNVGGLLWHEAPIETQALIIRTLLATGNRTQAVEAARWLLKQRQTTGWCSSAATAAAVTALMATGADVQLESDPDITIYVGRDAVKANDSKATAGYTTQTWDGPISRDKAAITVDAKTPGISWGAIYRTFTEDMDKVEHSENGMTLKRTIWRVIHGTDADRLEEVKPGTKLRVGDRLKIQFELTTDRNLEYLQLADCRAATVEPSSTHAGYVYNWRDDIGYYAAPGNTRNVFYIDRLSKGSYVIEYEVNVQKPGRFTVGNAVMQCLYAPAFRATTTSAVIEVE